VNVLISGSTGLIGSALAARLADAGEPVRRLVRPGARCSETDVRWDPAGGQIDPEALPGSGAVVHLAAESIVGRWTAAKKARIRDSREGPTRLLCRALADLADPPAVLACASAVGFYGDRGDEVLSEDSPAGEGFLPSVCRDWEAAAAPAVARGIRVVHLRFGVVLSRSGGALRRMLLPFRLGLGGRIGGGEQFWSWISLDDAVSAILHVLRCEPLRGAVNVVAPNPVTNRRFTKALAGVLRRPALLPMPASAARLLFGQMAKEVLLASARAQPRKLLDSGFVFRHPELGGALRDILP